MFQPTEDVWDLLPQSLERVKANEDAFHAGEGLATWRRLFFHKRHWIEWCQDRFLPTLVDGRTRAFLEIGGGLCYASALAKDQAPQAFVLATDLSPRYLRKNAVEVGRIMGSSADAYAAVDVEALPFEDRQFDAIYSQIVLCRLPDPVRALREIWRVLAPGGTYLAVEHATPWGWFAFSREARDMDAWSRPLGLVLKPLRFRDWQRIAAEAGFAISCVQPIPGRRVRHPWLRRLVNAWRPIHLSLRITR